MTLALCVLAALGLLAVPGLGRPLWRAIRLIGTVLVGILLMIWTMSPRAPRNPW